MLNRQHGVSSPSTISSRNLPRGDDIQFQTPGTPALCNTSLCYVVLSERVPTVRTVHRQFLTYSVSYHHHQTVQGQAYRQLNRSSIPEMIMYMDVGNLILHSPVLFARSTSFNEPQGKIREGKVKMRSAIKHQSSWLKM